MIEVGEYIRDKEGNITKIINTLSLFKDVELYLGEDSYQYSDNAIKKHSKNITDLLKVGDIVEMYDVLNEDVIYIWNEEMLKAVKEDVNNGIKIRRILTKEQYEATCYKVKEE